MMCDRTTTNIAGGQAGFIQFVVMPIFTQLSTICPDIQDLQLATGYKNIEKWKARANKEQKLREKEDKLNAKLEAFRLDEMKSDILSNKSSTGTNKS